MKNANSKIILPRGAKNLKTIVTTAFLTLTTLQTQAQWDPNWYPVLNWNGTSALSSPIFADATPWALGGNDIVAPAYYIQGSNFSLGTVNNVPLAFKTDNKECVYIDGNQNMAIGDGNTPAPGCVLNIRGNNTT